MITEQRVVAVLKVFLVLLFVILVGFQAAWLPGEFARLAERSADFAGVRLLMTAGSIAGLLCVQVVIVSIWRLLTLVANDTIFSDASLGWVNAIVWAIGAAWVMLLGVFLTVVIRWPDPGLPLLLFLALVGVAVLGLLMVVMRALLRQATTLRTDMQAVI
ncbi:DUF2975 domain-containing protein [Spirilliplanes yamanashiensis]|uniref:Membrane protein n=1 Tax=Spirilliplanes yamanashiensis TaxID=42233 RepID=A0A8J3Y5W2_9ACTN|nr:DUF2975 domain-containing protein [Spirilliplanes yamanashiensis]MDP9814777.1 hypothetical protein [Spirilliplanes yamanashiensis]GIJ02431.1 membrane protein [Spirilliplanes yamanashiensis]